MSGKTRQSLLSSQLKFYPTISYISATLLAWREEVILIRDALGLYDILIKLKQPHDSDDSTMMDWREIFITMSLMATCLSLPFCQK